MYLHILFLNFLLFFFFFNDTATTEIYTLSLHDALPISAGVPLMFFVLIHVVEECKIKNVKCLRFQIPVNFSSDSTGRLQIDRKSTRLNSSHGYISYAVFCLKKKKKI